MTPQRAPIRLLFEILLIMAVAQAAVMLALPSIAAGMGPRGQLVLSAALLVLLAGPTVYWRCMAGTRPAPTISSGKGPRSSTVRSAIAMTAAAQALGLVVTGVCVLWQQRNDSAVVQQQFDRAAERGRNGGPSSI